MKEVTKIQEETSVLIKIVKDSDTYREYQAALDELKKYPDLKSRADAFRKENFLIYQAIESPVSFADVESLEEERTELSSYPQIDRFLKAELALCRTVQEIQNTIISGIRLE